MMKVLVAAASIIGVLASTELAGATPIQFGSNYYDFVPTTYDLPWADASADASASVFMGMNGHLATITSAAENNFLATTFPTFDGLALAWLGGYVAANGIGTWVVGPDAALNFSVGQTPLPGQYANWGGIEPNNAPSNVNMMVGNINWFGITHGQWADDTDATLAGEFSSGGIVGYFVEYSSVPGPIVGEGLPAVAMAALGLWAWRRRRVPRANGQPAFA
jgi:hypothetical protein